METGSSLQPVVRRSFPAKCRGPGARLVGSWAEDSPRGLRAYKALAAMECEYATELLAEIRDKQIAEDIVEFGIYKGCWINFLWQMTEQLGLRRRIYGFDSFERLSEPHPEHDMTYWKKGQYACLFERGFEEQRAFEEWRPTVANLEFEFLFYRPIGDFYLRVHHKK